MKIDLKFTLDTTGSMFPAKVEAENKILEACNTLFSDIPDLRIGIILHGDYEDARESYVTKHLSLTASGAEVYKFMRHAGRTNGYDSAECYELVMHEARIRPDWREDSVKILVMVGDATPHPASDSRNFLNLDWRKELDLLLKDGISVYPVQCLNQGPREDAFWGAIGATCYTPHLRLDQFKDLVEIISGIAYQQTGQLGQYQEKLAGQGMLNRGLARVLAQISGKGYERSEAEADRRYGHSDLERVPDGTFQILTVPYAMRISDFVEMTGANYKRGEGYYHFTKAEDIQPYKQVVLVHKRSGDMFTGRRAREMLGLEDGYTQRIRPTHLPDYEVFVQSTSYTRKLQPGLFLYKAV